MTKKDRKANKAEQEEQIAEGPKDLSERACNLECSKKPKVHTEFVGPVKIMLIDPSNKDYKRRIWGASLIGFANILMGATVITLIFFALNVRLPIARNAHVILGTIGLQMFLPSGVFMPNSLFGGASPLLHKHRKWSHILLMVMGLFFEVSSAIIIINKGNYKTHLTDHGIAGIISIVLACAASVFGPLLYFSSEMTIVGKALKLVHRFLGMGAVGAGSACFIIGLLRPSFMAWGNEVVKYMPYILAAFCVIYTSVTLFSPFMRIQTYQG